ncbi:MAG: cold shock domain-containing protein [Candidatus Undinarchaeales archaeon]
MKGTIKKFIDDKNYGFIEVEGGEEGKDLFFHKNDTAEGYHPKSGDAVEFKKEQSDKGPNAVNVKKAE